MGNAVFPYTIKEKDATKMVLERIKPSFDESDHVIFYVDGKFTIENGSTTRLWRMSDSGRLQWKNDDGRPGDHYIAFSSDPELYALWSAVISSWLVEVGLFTTEDK